MKLFSKLLSRLFIISGVFLLLFGFLLLYQRYAPNRLAFATEPESTVILNELVDVPSRLIIPGRSINQPIFLSEVLAGKWGVSPSGVSFLHQSVLPGEVGNSIMYGHNWSSILGDLETVLPDDVIRVEFQSGKHVLFEVEYVFEVEPSQVDILGPVNYARLTVYTCSGFLDSKRLVVVARKI